MEMEAAIEASYSAADDEWKDRALFAVKQIAEAFETFTAEDVWDVLPASAVNGSALGGVMRRAAKTGYAELIEGITIPSRMEEKHKRPTRIWRSKLHPNYVPTVTDNIPLTKGERTVVRDALKFVLDRYPTQNDEFKATASKFGVKL